MNLYKECTEKPYSFLVNNNPLHFRYNTLEGI